MTQCGSTAELRRAALGLLAALLLGLAMAPAHAQPAPGIRVHMHGAEGYAADGMLYNPKGEPPFAAIVLIPDERGITERLNQAVARFAEHGFLVIALDLNRGLPPEAAAHSAADALHDLDAALSFLTAQAAVRHDAMGLMGWGTGGNYALQFASDPRVTALLVIDPATLTAPAADGKSHAELLAVVAGRDASQKTQALKSFQVQAKQHGFALSVERYPQSDAGFDDPDNPSRYRSADAVALEKLQISFFSKHLRP